MRYRRDKLIDLYYEIPGYFMPYKMRYVYNKLLEKIFLIIVNNSVPQYYNNTKNDDRYGINKQVGKKKVSLIVSLTSFPARINTTHIAVESIFRQTIKPDKIILWLAGSQFPNKYDDLPKPLLMQIDRGLDIRFCDDLRSHKKYYYALKEYANDYVVIFDDDLFYHPGIIENLLNLNKSHPNCISAIRVHKMKIVNNNLAPYKSWYLNYPFEKPGILLHHNSGHGTLIPPNIGFDDIFFNKELIRTLSLHSDDVWFKVNLIRLNIPVVTNNRFKRDTIGIKGSYKSSLVSKNTHKGRKDELFRIVLNYFNIDNLEKYNDQ